MYPNATSLDRPDYAGAVAMLDHEGRVLLLRRGSTAPWMPSHWNLPGGMADAGETPQDAAIREAQEEISLTPEGLRLLHHDDGAYGATYIFLADSWSGVPRLTWENDAMVWAVPEEALSLPLVPGLREALEKLAQHPSHESRMPLAALIRNGLLSFQGMRANGRARGRSARTSRKTSRSKSSVRKSSRRKTSSSRTPREVRWRCTRCGRVVYNHSKSGVKTNKRCKKARSKATARCKFARSPRKTSK
jgi:8-oxo-dGTP pyrophosphatase MutT (NUDIX family)